MRAAVVRVGEGAEALLARGVEEVEPVGSAVDGEAFDLEVYADGGGAGFGVELVVTVADKDCGLLVVGSWRRGRELVGRLLGVVRLSWRMEGTGTYGLIFRSRRARSLIF